jgi:ABC-type Co2+ transport system permease subunit
MAFVNRLLLIVPSFGQPIQNDTLFLKSGTATASGANTVTMGSLTPALKQGWIRFKLSGGAASSTLTSMIITVTDGTTTENVYSNTLVATNNSFVSPNIITMCVPFLTDTTGVTSVSFIFVTAGTSGVGIIDTEIGAGN